MFSTKPHDERFLIEANAEHGHELRFTEARLTPATAVLAAGCEVVCPFVNDDLGQLSCPGWELGYWPSGQRVTTMSTLRQRPGMA